MTEDDAPGFEVQNFEFIRFINLELSFRVFYIRYIISHKLYSFSEN